MFVCNLSLGRVWWIVDNQCPPPPPTDLFSFLSQPLRSCLVTPTIPFWPRNVDDVTVWLLDSRVDVVCAVHDDVSLSLLLWWKETKGEKDEEESWLGWGRPHSDHRSQTYTHTKKVAERERKKGSAFLLTSIANQQVRFQSNHDIPLLFFFFVTPLEKKRIIVMIVAFVFR